MNNLSLKDIDDDSTGMTEENQVTAKTYILNKLQLLIKEAKELGIVIEVNIESKTPLAMGNYDMVPSVREARLSSLIRPKICNLN